MSQNLNPSSSNLPNYGATTSRAMNIVPDITFSPTEFVSLSEEIAQNISGINSSCIQLEKSLKSNKTQNYAHIENQKKVHDIHLKTKTRIDTIGRDLQRLTSIVIRGDKQQKLQLEKLTKSFTDVVERYSTAQQQVAAAMKQAILRPIHKVAQNLDDIEEQEQLIQYQQQVEANLRLEQTMMEDRQRQIEQIEVMVLDVNSMMLKMADYVQQQSESVDRIETTIEYSANEVESGRSELEKAAAHRQSYRRKIFYILIIAVIVGVIVTGIIIASINK